MFDAYTVKKVLPRLVIAAILIQLSWEIFTLMILIVGNIAWGVEGLLYAPFGGRDALQLEDLVASSAGGPGLFVAVTTVAAAGAALTAVSLGVVLSLALSAFIAIAIGFFVLVIRQVVILVLLVLAPIALVAWILPNTEKVWKLWWESFSKLLFMYPLILLLIAAGRIFAAIATDIPDFNDESLFENLAGNAYNMIIVVVGFFAPFFLIPKTFQVAGSAFANITGMVNNRSRGVFDRLRKGRQQSMANTWDRTKSGNRFQGGTATNARGRVNRALQTAALSPKGGLTLNAATRRARMTTARNTQDFINAKKFLEENDTMRGIKGDDDKMWALMNANSEEEVRAELRKRAKERFADPVALENATAEVMRAKREGGARVSQLAATIAQFGTGTGYNYRQDGIDDDMMNAVIKTAGDDNGLAGRIIAEGRGLASQSGRIDLAGGGFAKTMQILERRRTAMKTADAGYTAADARREVIEDVLQSNAGAAVAGKLEGLKQMTPIMRAKAKKALESGDTELAGRELAKLAGRYDAAAQIAPQNADELRDSVLAQEIDVTSLPKNIQAMLAGAAPALTPEGLPKRGIITYQQAIEALRGDQNFQVMRREYQSATSAEAARRAEQDLAARGVAPAIEPPVKPFGQ